MNNTYIRVLIDEVVAAEKILTKYVNEYSYVHPDDPLYNEHTIQAKEYEKNYINSVTKLGNYIYKNRIDFVELLRKAE
jgi:hypothetical protein